MSTFDLHTALCDAAREEGFPAAGALDLDLAREQFAPHLDRYDDWLDRGQDATMTYLRRGRDRRADPRQVFPEAQSILCVAQPYPARAAGQTNPRQGPRYARYLRRLDYHEEISARLERVMVRVASQQAAIYANAGPSGGASGTAGPTLRWKTCVDHRAVLERSWAALAGLGWIGKNTLLIHPQLGSYLFLGEVLINQPTGHGPRPLPDYCGRCTRCLVACPSRALEERRLDANRCISYWTLEKRGELGLTEPDRRAVGGWIAGCDLCQEVCPFNTKATRADLTALTAGAPGPDGGAIQVDRWPELLRETEAEYRARTRHSALSRVKPAQFRRNLALTLANAIAETGAGAWTDPLRPLIAEHLRVETDTGARAEWQRCLNLLGDQRVSSGDPFSSRDE